ncbi:MAG TPA: SpoIIE family protein phosphatase [Gaiellaceae bacterium]|nr:SpoIIE family protein phosphatase [Gaiellaceae bacterium]
MAVPTHGAALEGLAEALASAGGRPGIAAALHDLADAARALAEADVALVRVQVDAERLEAVAVAGAPALAAELEGTRLRLDELPALPLADAAEAPPCVRRAAERAAARSLLVVPVPGERAATVELYRGGDAFDEQGRLAAEVVAGAVPLVLRAFEAVEGAAATQLARPALELAGEALAAALDTTHTAGEVARVAATVVGAPVGVVWEGDLAGGLRLAGFHGLDADGGHETLRELAAAALADTGPVHPLRSGDLPGGCGISVGLPLGQPPVGLLQLLFAADDEPGPEQLARLTTFGVRAAQALRLSSRSRSLERELERTRALLTVVGDTTAELSLAHTLETAVDLVGELLGVRSVALYLRAEEDRLVAAAERGLAGPHVRVGERLLELALTRARATLRVDDVPADIRLRDVRDAAREAGIESALAVPLLVRDAVVGLLAVYGDVADDSLLSALAGQLAVAIQNAQLHEQATELGRQREAALAAERAAARRQRALYEISRSFAEGLSLDDTLDALAQTVVEVLDLDAALIALPDGRRELLVPRSLYVADPALADPTRVILFRPQPFGSAEVQRLFRSAQPFRIERGHELLEPFLARGWTAAVIPVGVLPEVIAALTILSFKPGSPLAEETLDAASTIAAQAALAIDNARLYQQQKEFADTMQRSLLPRGHPEVEGLEVGEVYESSARVEVGGDVYDFLDLPDGRLAVVLGDVTGHGVEATADMAMAKFVFRSLAREHPEPADFLARANDVVVDEIAPGKFITMTYVAVDGRSGAAACANAGHPAPRVVLADGTVHGLESHGLILGIDSAQEYEEATVELPPGGSLVLYTDGVVEARRDSELYGVERLDALLAEHRALAPRELAERVAADARAWSGGELSDDLAVVVIRRVG